MSATYRALLHRCSIDRSQTEKDCASSLVVTALSRISLSPKGIKHP